jgi:hypothetical protein
MEVEMLKKLFGGVVGRSSKTGVNLTPGKAVQAPNGDLVLPGEQWTAPNGDIYQNQNGELILIQIYNDNKGKFGHQKGALAKK